MNNNRVPLGPWLGISWGADTPPALDRHILRARHVVAIGNRWMCLIEAAELAALADMPDAAFVLGSRRGYLSDSQVNQAFANALRERPEDVGFFGAPIVLSSRSPHWEPGWGGGSGLLGFAGVQCFDGFQRLVTMAHLARELPPGHLSRALLWVVVVTGEDVDRGRELCDEVAHHINPLEPQDNLVRCPDLLRVQAEFRQEGGFFDPRRGIVSGPHPVGFTPADVFRSLAALSLAPRPYLSNQLQTVEGLNGLWSDITGPAYRSLVHEGLHAISIQRAVEARRETQKVIARMLKRNSKGVLEAAGVRARTGDLDGLPGAAVGDAPRREQDVAELDEAHQRRARGGDRADRAPAGRLVRATSRIGAQVQAGGTQARPVAGTRGHGPRQGLIPYPRHERFSSAQRAA
ncbi:hypothetical protein [Kitasatospora sp. MY 5-36]|uniref:hypothetical protein n=1 Tax=Kitasatospora sp. MY 5-36 TaxID=1678027 RepID=UPI00069DC8A8|nr:hypothetical protein [Kitasatospora sp. MY 5-36]